jgi:hypothetical protein
MGYKRNAYRLLVGTLGRPRLRLVHNIKMDLGGIGCSGVDGIGLAQDTRSDQRMPLVNAVMNRRVPHNAGKFCRSSILK